ncbi:MAG: DUF3090 domain-containing protein [Anaerolineae bacterium]
MPQFDYDFDPVSRITVGAIGRPGQRDFYLQARSGLRVVTLKIEKQQVQALAIGISQLLEQIGDVLPQLRTDLVNVNNPRMTLEEPVYPAFMIGQIGLGYDEARALVIIIAQELVVEDAEGSSQAALARFVAGREMMRDFSEHALALVAAGRPTCPLCGQPIDPRGHFCPPSNGHSTSLIQ